MRNSLRLALVVTALVILAAPLRAQAPEGVMSDFVKDITEVEMKVVGLAKAMPASASDWRPGKGVRSTAEVLLHIAADNYFIPAALGMPAPAETGNGLRRRPPQPAGRPRARRLAGPLRRFRR